MAYKKINHEHQSWCFEHGFHVLVEPNHGMFTIYVKNGQREYKYGDFRVKELWDEVWGLYTKIYEKNKDRWQ